VGEVTAVDLARGGGNVSVEAFHALGRALVEPSLLISADGIVLAANQAAASRMPDLPPGTDIAALVGDLDAWERFLVDVRRPDRRNIGRIALRAPVDATYLVVSSLVDPDDERSLVLVRVLHTSSEPSGEGDIPTSEVTTLLERTDRNLVHHDRLEAIVGETSAMVFVKDRAGRYVTVNREFARVRNASREELVGQTALDLLGPEAAAPVELEEEQVWATGESRTRYTTVLVDGEERSYVTVKFPLPQPAGEASLLAGIAVDITDRARAETALVVAAQQLREAQRVGQLGNWERDLTTDSLTSSEALAELFDVPPGSPLSALAARYHPADVGVVADIAERVRAGGGRQRGRFRIIRSDGTVRWMEVTVDLVGEQGAPRLVGVTQDVTEREEAARSREELEGRLRQVERLESVGQLAGGIAHDFNNILAVVLLQTELMLSDLPEDAPEADDVRRIRDAAERAGGLTRQLLEFSHGDGGVTTAFDLGAVVASVTSLLERTLGEHIRLVVERPDDLWAAVADATRVEQVVLNLAVNARDAMPDGGVLTLRLANQEIDEVYAAIRPGLTPGPYVELAVTDTGVGMAPEVRQRAFDPFFTTKPKGRGTGLGLASVYGTVTAARGHVEIYSEPGIGTVVRVLLPASVTPEEQRARPEGDVYPGEGRRIVVVEDDDPVRTLVADVLQRAGYDVQSFESSAAALAALDTASIDVLVTDVVLTDMPGPELAEQVVRRHPHIGVLLMSGYTDGLLNRPGRRAYRHAFLSKPFTSQRLLRAVAELAAPVAEP
jgi:PAS domain S-box-containing protein